MVEVQSASSVGRVPLQEAGEKGGPMAIYTVNGST